MRNRPTLIAGRYKVNYPIGVSASPLTSTSKWIKFYSERGFDILTYKTVRTHEWPAYKSPNWVFITDKQVRTYLNEQIFNMFLEGDKDYWPVNPEQITMANSFGIPSMSPEKWQQDVRRARELLQQNQVLIVSVTGTTEDQNLDADQALEVLKQDFVKVADMAANAGAQIVELNFSCPNIPGHKEGDLYRDPDASSSVSEAVKKALGEIPVFIKIGYLPKDLLAKVVQANEKYIDGIVAINTIAMPVVDKFGDGLFPPSPDERTRAGISGSALKPLAMEVVKNLSNLRKKHKHYKFDIIGLGGAMTPQDVQDYLDAGATAVQSCTGVLMNPNLAIDTRFHSGGVPSPELLTVVYNNGAGKGGRHVTKEAENSLKEVNLTPSEEDRPVFKLLQRMSLDRETLMALEDVYDLLFEFELLTKAEASETEKEKWLADQTKALENAVKAFPSTSDNQQILREEIDWVKYELNQGTVGQERIDRYFTRVDENITSMFRSTEPSKNVKGFLEFIGGVV